MKSVFALIIILPKFALSQMTDSIKKKAIDLQFRAWEAEKDKQFDRCITLADSSIIVDSNRSEPYVLKSECLWFTKRYAEAAEVYKKWIEKSKPSDILVVGAHVMVGMLYDKAHMENEARQEYLKAISFYETGKMEPLFKKYQEIDYLYAWGLLPNRRKWKQKLKEYLKKHPGSDYEELMNKTKAELLKIYFSKFEIGGG